MTTTSTEPRARARGSRPPSNHVVRPTRHELARDCCRAAEELLASATAGHDVVEAAEELVDALRVLTARTTPAATRDAREAADVAHSGAQPPAAAEDNLPAEEEPDDGAGQAYDAGAWGDPDPLPVGPAVPTSDRRVWALR